jgi:hypothetical protein
MTKQTLLTVGDLAKDANSSIKTAADAKKWWAAKKKTLIPRVGVPAQKTAIAAGVMSPADRFLEAHVGYMKRFLNRRTLEVLEKHIENSFYS